MTHHIVVVMRKSDAKTHTHTRTHTDTHTLSMFQKCRGVQKEATCAYRTNNTKGNNDHNDKNRYHSICLRHAIQRDMLSPCTMYDANRAAVFVLQMSWPLTMSRLICSANKYLARTRQCFNESPIASNGKIKVPAPLPRDTPFPPPIN